MHNRHRYELAGALVGALLAAYFVNVQLRADLRGVRILGVVELMSVVSLPVSVLSWTVVLLGLTLALPLDAETPRWVAYAWLALTPVLNWAFLGWLLGALRDRRQRPQPPVEPAA